MPHRFANNFIEEKTAIFLKRDIQEVIDIHVGYLFQLGWLPARYSKDGVEIGIHTVESNDQYTKVQYGKFLIEFPTHVIQGDTIDAWMNIFTIEIDGKEKIVFSKEKIAMIKKTVDSLVEGSHLTKEDPQVSRMSFPSEYYKIKNIIRLYEK